MNGARKITIRFYYFVLVRLTAEEEEEEAASAVDGLRLLFLTSEAQRKKLHR
jgi:hypothetical protein